MNATLSMFERQGYMHVPLLVNVTSNIKLAVREWERFCAHSTMVKESFRYEDGVGYEHKIETGETLDLKENFHYTIAAHHNLAATAKEIAKRVEDMERLGMFVNCSRLVLHALGPIIRDTAETLEREYNLVGLAEEVRQSEAKWFLRYLHYFGDRSPGEEIASSHVDKSGMTFHLYESETGLEYLPYELREDEPRKWRSMPLAKDTTVVIPGMQLQYKSTGRLRALCHRVVANSRTAYQGRYSMVCFVPFTMSPKYNKSAAGRLQEFPPGFNYSMPPEEFGKLFA